MGQEFWLLLRFSKVTRRQSGTLSGRYRRNGYVHHPTVLTARPPSRASPLPQLDRGVSGREASAVRPLSQASQLPQLDCGVSGREVSAGRPPSQASQLPLFGRGVSGRYGSAGRPSSQASQLPLFGRGCQVESPSPQQRCVHLLDQVISACTGASRPMACRRA